MPVAWAGEEETPAGDQTLVAVADEQQALEEQAGSESGETALLQEPPSPPLLSTNEEPPLVLPPLLINRIVAGISGDSTHDYIELYNPNPHKISIDSWHVAVSRGGGEDLQVFTIHGELNANGHIFITSDDIDELNPDFQLQSDLFYVDGVVQLIDNSNLVVEQVTWGDFPTALTSKLATGKMFERNYSSEGVPYLTGNINDDFARKDAAKVSPERAGGYVPYVAPIHRCNGLMISEIAANVATDKQFIELYNPTSLPIILDGCLLQTNRSTTKSYELSGVLEPGAYKNLTVTSTGLTLTKTTTGTLYILSSDGKEEADARSYDGLAAETSWAWFGGNDWRQTFSPTPGQANTWQEFLPC
jgi:hypothetical protein